MINTELTDFQFTVLFVLGMITMSGILMLIELKKIREKLRGLN